MKKIPVWIDTDTGVDDAVALLTAVQLEELEIVGVSSVAGNTSHENAFRNARDVLSLANRADIKVYPGSDKPLVRKLYKAEYVHGSNGLGGAEIPASKAKKQTTKAWDAIYDCAKKLQGELTLIAIGPLTNVATMIINHPDVVNYIKELNIMGGAAQGGNVTPCAEFNIYVDPEAAQTVFKSGIPVNMFGLDVTLKAYLTDEDIAEIKAYGNKVSELFANSNDLLYAAQEAYHRSGLCEHDACPVIYTVHPEWFEGYHCGIFVETRSKICDGKTCTDLWTDYKYEDRHCQVFLNLDRQKFVSCIKNAYKAY